MFKKLSTKALGDDAETRALEFLLHRNLRLEARNYRVARGPTGRGGEIDLIMRTPDGTLVFIEVRTRAARDHGGAAASVTRTKQRRLVYAASHYLSQLRTTPPCRFDVVAIDGDHIEWLPAAFDAKGW